MIASMFLSAIFGAMVLAVVVCFVLGIRRWHSRELGGSPEQWYSVRRIMARHDDDD